MCERDGSIMEVSFSHKSLNAQPYITTIASDYFHTHTHVKMPHILSTNICRELCVYVCIE